jgi:hypothetical protein
MRLYSAATIVAMRIRLHHYTCLFAIIYLVAMSGCSTKSGGMAHDDSDPCGLLSSAEIESVQGEPVSAMKADRHSTGAFISSQCFYTLPTYSKSISLDVMKPSGNGGDTAEFWDQRFHKTDPDENEEATERSEPSKNSAADREAEEEKAKARPLPVSGIGDEAFWTGTQINGSLYIRRGSDIIRISIGGADDQSAKIDKAKSLAEKVITRLK